MIVALSLALLAAGAPSDQGLASEPHPNLILIVADDLGWGDLGSYGQQRIRTPNLDRLAREGMRFTDFYAGSTVCAPSRCVLMTGHHVGRAFIRANGKKNLRPEDLTVAEVLRTSGYTTALIGKWGLGHEGSTGVPTRQGFDRFFGYLDQSHAHNYYPHFLVRNETRIELKNVVPKPGRYGQGVATEKREYSHDLFAAEALAFVEQERAQPFFLYLALTIPHANNEAGKAGMEVPDLGPYAELDWPDAAKGHAAMITRMDADIGRLVDKLHELGLADDTVILFTSDNGPHAEGGYRPEMHDSNGPLRGHKRSLYEGGIRVPLIAWSPGRIKAGILSDHIGGFQDVLPTLAELAGAEEAVPPEIDGLSFAPTLLGRSTRQKQHEHLYWVFFEQGGRRAVRRGNWKAVQDKGRTIELYRLDEDPGESKDLSGQYPERVQAMRARLEAGCELGPDWAPPND